VFFVARFIGFWLVAAAIVAFVIDGTKSIAESSLILTPLGQTWFELHPASLSVLQAVIQRYLHPLIWDPVIQFILTMPTWTVTGILGLLLLSLGRRRKRQRTSAA